MDQVIMLSKDACKKATDMERWNLVSMKANNKANMQDFK